MRIEYCEDMPGLSLKSVQQKDYWINKLSGELNRTSFSDWTNNTGESKSLIMEIPLELSSSLIRLGKNSDLSLYIILNIALKVLLFKYTNNDDIIVFSPAYKIIQEGKVPDNLLPLRDDITEDMSLKDFLLSVKETVLNAYKNQEFPVKKLFNQSDDSNEAEFHQLSEAVCLLDNIHELDCSVNKEFLVFGFSRTNNALSGFINYNSNSYNENFLSHISKHYLTILNSIVCNIDTKIGDLVLLSGDDEYEVIHKFNCTEKDICLDRSIIEIFEEQVDINPDNVAVVFENCELTFGDLNSKSNQLARKLVSKGVAGDSIVAIMVERSFEMIIGIFGVLKAGAAYLPIDPEYPEDRINYMLEDSETRILLTQKHLKCRVNLPGIEIITFDDLLYTGDRSNLGIYSRPDNLTYLIYTSGTTGKPKGVMIEQRSVLTYVYAFYNEFNITNADTIIQQASYSFDHFVEELYPVILKGGKIVVVSKSTLTDMVELSKVIRENNVTIVSFSPLMLNELNRLNDYGNIRLFLSGGDVLKGEYISNLLDSGPVYNTYGPTEATVCASYHKCERNNKSNMLIGKPIANYKVYILDKNRKPLPIGVPGEIYISGAGVARGYLKRPELNSDRFFEDPFNPGLRMYRTGDMARWLEDGNIQFLGRIDNQVKIRGYRIELGEIESLLLRNEHIKETIVLDREDKNGNKFLCAYIVSESEIKDEDLRDFLLKELPEYMVPSFFVRLEKMPLTLNSFKIDRKALPNPLDFLNIESEFVKPRNDTELKLAEIWAEIIGIENMDEIGVNSRFFELGGHSIKALQLAARIYKEFNVHLTLNSIGNPTIESLCRIIESSGKSAENSVISVEESQIDEKINSFGPDVPRKKLIEGIEPFNDIFYNECLYNALFPVVNLYGGDIGSVLSNDIIGYKFNRSQNKTEFGIEFISEKTLEEVLETVGIDLERKFSTSDMLQDIVFSIAGGQLFILVVDCFYESIREDSYQKIHWPHTLCIYGYDLDRKVFNILEHDSINSILYKPAQISIKDALEASNGYIVNYRKESRVPIYYRFSQGEKAKACLRDDNRFGSNYLRYHQENKKIIYKGLDELRHFITVFEKATQNVSGLEAFIESIFYNIEAVINSRESERYRVKRFFQEEIHLSDILDEIIRLWRNFKLVIEKCRFKSSYTEKSLELLKERVNTIYKLEMQFYELIFNMKI